MLAGSNLKRALKLHDPDQYRYLGGTPPAQDASKDNEIRFQGLMKEEHEACVGPGREPQVFERDGHPAQRPDSAISAVWTASKPKPPGPVSPKSWSVWRTLGSRKTSKTSWCSCWVGSCTWAMSGYGQWRRRAKAAWLRRHHASRRNARGAPRETCQRASPEDQHYARRNDHPDPHGRAGR